MVDFGTGLPGDRYGMRSRLAQMLMRGDANNGTTLGGLAHVGNQLLAASLLRQDMDEVATQRARPQAANQAIADARRLGAGQPPLAKDGWSIQRIE
jgi:hypothetical protein